MVAAVLRNFGRRVRNNPQPSVVPGFLRPIDTQQIARTLQLAVVAEKRGQQDLPSTADHDFDATEQTIVQKIESEWGWQGEELLNQLSAYAARLLGYSIPAEFERLRLMAEDAIARLRNTAQHALADLAPLKDNYIAHRDELNRFKAEQNIQRPPRERSRRWTSLGLLILLVGFESALNGFFFAKGSDFGLVGGVGVAVGVSITNVICAFLIGLGPARWKNRASYSASLPSFLLMIVGCIAIFALHVFVAHFRDATVSLGEDRALAAAVTSFLQSPWLLSDINSYYLFGLGLIFAAAAFYKGYTFDDPYPGYGAMHRRMVAAREAYTRMHFQFFGELDRVKDEVIAEIDSGIARIPKFPQLFANSRNERAATIDKFRAYETAVETATNQLLKQYREINRVHRKTAPPSYFDQRWSLPHSFLNSPQVETLLADPQIGDVDSSLSSLGSLSARLLEEYEKLARHYPHPSEMT